MKSQNLHIMNSSSKAKDNINKFSSKKSLIDPSPSKVQFNLRVCKTNYYRVVRIRIRKDQEDYFRIWEVNFVLMQINI